MNPSQGLPNTIRKQIFPLWLQTVSKLHFLWLEVTTTGGTFLKGGRIRKVESRRKLKCYSNFYNVGFFNTQVSVILTATRWGTRLSCCSCSRWETWLPSCCVWRTKNKTCLPVFAEPFSLVMKDRGKLQTELVNVTPTFYIYIYILFQMSWDIWNISHYKLILCLSHKSGLNGPALLNVY